MKFRHLMVVAFLCATMIISVNANAAKQYDTGASDTEIRLGHTSPLSGPVSAWGNIGKCMTAYFKMVNDNGGINGRKINFIMYDDGYLPPKTLEMTRKLVESDQVLFMAGSMGTVPQIAVAPYLNEHKIPQLFCATSAHALTEGNKLPYSMSSNFSYSVEGAIYAKYLFKNKPNAKVAVLYQDDDYGRAVFTGFKETIPGSSVKIVIEQPYSMTDATIDSQIIALKHSGADVVLLCTVPKFTAQAMRKIRQLSWDPLIFIAAGGATVTTGLKPAGLENCVGVIGVNYQIKIADLAYSNHPDVVAFKKFVAKYLPGVDPNDDPLNYGYQSATLTEYVLRQAGDNLTRANIMKIANSLNWRGPLLLPGITYKTTPIKHAPIRQLYLMKFDGTSYKIFGDVISAD